MKKLIIVCSIAFLVIAVSTVPAMAYTALKTPVSITATGTITGSTIAFTATCVAQATGTAASNISFTSPSGITDSGEAIKIKGGTNEVNARVVIYTDNATNAYVPTVNPNTGIDGAGLVGNADPSYTVALFWGTNTGSALAPNTNVDYVFGDPAVPVEGGTGNCVYIVDKRHTHSFTGTDNAPYAANPAPFNTAAGMDNTNMYTLAGAVVTNTSGDGLYPQAWDQDYYDKINTDSSRKIVSSALYSSIGTVMYGIQVGAGTDAGYYIGNVGELKTLSSSDSINARLSKTDATAGGEMYIYIGGDFTGKPAQVYSTTKLTVAIVNN